MIRSIGPINSGAAAGGAGVSTATFTTPIDHRGKVLGVYVRYNDSPPAATCDVTIATLGTDPKPPALTLLTLTDAATDGYFWIRHMVKDEAGALVTWDGTNEIYESPVVDDRIKVTIAQANIGDSVDVWLILED